MDGNLDFANFTTSTPPLAIHGWKAMDLSFNLAPSYRDLKDPTSRQNFEDTVEQKRVIDLRACHIRKAMHLRVNLKFLGAILVHPVRRQNFAEKMHLRFYNI